MQDASRSTSLILPWRYGLFLLAFASAVPLSILSSPLVGIMLGFDLAALIFLATLSSLFRHDATVMRRHARENDANRTVMLVLTGVVMVAIMFAVASELRQKSASSLPMLALIIATLILAWLFSNLVYTLHYAFLYYRGAPRGDHGGLRFPERGEPDYWDFAYFALTLGMTFQTSDVEITSPLVRRTALLHSFAAFVFNLGVIAFTINILGG